MEPLNTRRWAVEEKNRTLPCEISYFDISTHRTFLLNNFHHFTACEYSLSLTHCRHTYQRLALSPSPNVTMNLPTQLCRNSFHRHGTCAGIAYPWTTFKNNLADNHYASPWRITIAGFTPHIQWPGFLLPYGSLMHHVPSENWYPVNWKNSPWWVQWLCPHWRCSTYSLFTHSGLLRLQEGSYRATVTSQMFFRNRKAESLLRLEECLSQSSCNITGGLSWDTVSWASVR